MIRLKDLPSKELLYGHLGCAGCGGILAVRMALKVLGPDTIIVMPACCAMAVTCFYPTIPFEVPYMVSTFGATASAVSGVVAAMKRKGREDINVVGIGGDGGTIDIGLQALSGAVERMENFIYICYDNEAYMNTGIQRSSATPFGARTTTTPVGKKGMFEDRPKKNIFEILVAHDIPYVARASVGYPLDYMEKVKRAMEVKGPAFIHVLAPCPPGWGTDTKDTIKLARDAVQSGLWVMEEWDQGVRRITKKVGNPTPVKEYMKKQARFRHLKDTDYEFIQKCTDETCQKAAAAECGGAAAKDNPKE